MRRVLERYTAAGRGGLGLPRAECDRSKGAGLCRKSQPDSSDRSSGAAWCRPLDGAPGIARYRADGIAGLEDRSHVPKHHLWQTPDQVEAVICELRQANRRRGPRRWRFELGRLDFCPPETRSPAIRRLSILPMPDSASRVMVHLRRYLHSTELAIHYRRQNTQLWASRSTGRKY
jgi:hypothetical protein